ncbi:hypothetical protein HNY73_008420 [Argiope bruennichi]|uniref:Uncharacterized protein n=1 Tax=Argiope bruennichi TaxID=94029 RepID=A0A8T0F7A1_ARGBR|nr:hypothetical protein HNY73_008420 [Argiope bruennichi]
MSEPRALSQPPMSNGGRVFVRFGGCTMKDVIRKLMIVNQSGDMDNVDRTLNLEENCFAEDMKATKCRGGQENVGSVSWHCGGEKSNLPTEEEGNFCSHILPYSSRGEPTPHEKFLRCQQNIAYMVESVWLCICTNSFWLFLRANTR